MNTELRWEINHRTLEKVLQFRSQYTKIVYADPSVGPSTIKEQHWTDWKNIPTVYAQS